MEDYNYLSGYGDYGSPSQLISKKTVEDITANAPKELDTFKEVADKISELEGGSSSDLTELNEKIEAKADKSEVDAKLEEVNTALEAKADASALEGLATEDFVENKISGLIDGAPTTLDTLREIANALNDNATMTMVSEAISTKVNTEDFNAHVSENTESFAAINETLSEKADKSELPDVSGFITMNDVEAKGYITETDADEKYQPKGEYLTEHQDLSEYAKIADIPTVPTKVSELENDVPFLTEHQSLDNYALKADLDDYVKTEDLPAEQDMSIYALKAELNDYQPKGEYLTEHQDLSDYALKSELPTVPTNVSSFTNDAGYITEHQDLSDYATKTYVDDGIANINIPDVSGFATTEALNTAISGITLPEVPENVSEFTNDAGYLTALTGDERYYGKETVDSIFVAKSQYEDDMDLKANKSELEDYTTDSDLNSVVHDLVVRLNKLEAQNAVLIEKGTESADDITGMTAEEAASADIVVATDEAIEALSTPKTFNSINIAGGELGGDTVINLFATDSVEVNGMTVSGTKGSGNGKIVYATNDITINNLNIEPGCTVYNVFEGSQDKDAQHCIDNFTATNVTVNDTDLKHNVFNIYQFNDGANVLIKDSSFNLDVANSNILRISNITNAKNVTITFENVDWTYENKAYSDSDKKWAGLMIYQPYGTDAAFSGDTTNTNTWTINVKNCRYNGNPITENKAGTIEQSVYQYNISNNGLCEAPSAFGSVNIE